MVKIAVVTGTRADYYLLRPLLRALKNSSWCKPGIFVTGAHCTKAGASSLQALKKDGFSIFQKIDLKLGKDQGRDIAHAYARAVQGFANAYAKHCPELVVLFGDRYEMLAAATAALFMRIPMAHINGGDITMGAYDDAMRHSIAKMAQIHFPSNHSSANTLRQLGESPSTIHNVGSLAIDCMQSTKQLSQGELAKALGLPLREKNMLVTFHPETLSSVSVDKQITELLKALRHPRFSDHLILFTGTNADTEGSKVRKKIAAFVKTLGNAHFIETLGHERYFNALRHFNLVIGNSSSGVLEAPFLGCATINIGDRQKGRPLAPSVFSASFKAEDIVQAIERGLRWNVSGGKKRSPSLYGQGDTAEQITRILREKKPWNSNLKKEFNRLLSP